MKIYSCFCQEAFAEILESGKNNKENLSTDFPSESIINKSSSGITDPYEAEGQNFYSNPEYGNHYRGTGSAFEGDLAHNSHLEHIERVIYSPLDLTEIKESKIHNLFEYPRGDDYQFYQEDHN